MVFPLPADQNILGSIPGSSGELFDGAYGFSVSVFQCPLLIFCPMLSLVKAPDCWTIYQGRPINCIRDTICCP